MDAFAAPGTLRLKANRLAALALWRDLALLLSTDEDTTIAQPELIALLAEAYMRAGRARDAHAWLARTMHVIRRRGDRVVLRRAVNLLGAAQFELGELDGARDAFERALQLGREDGDDLLTARAMNNLGAICNVRGEREQALALYMLALAAYQGLGHALGQAESSHNMAITFRQLGQLARADDCERRAIEFSREAGSVRLLALASVGRAEISLAQGDVQLAEAAAVRAVRQFAAIPDPVQETGALRLVGEARLAQGRGEAAKEALDEALDLARAHGSALDEAEILRVRATERLWTGDAAAARSDACAAMAIFGRLDAGEERAALERWIATLPSAGRTP
jgi:tetratricopeptide (TPR) repeat protein